MILASAQVKPIQYDIDANLNEHYQMIKIAADFGAELIVFPEMSITGYEREIAGNYAFYINDSRLDLLKKMAHDYHLYIIAGAPVQINSHLYIGSFIIKPDNQVLLYTKQFLHPGEEVYFSSSFDYNPVIELQNEKIGFAICADIDHPQHPENASKLNCSIYIPSIFFSPNGIPVAHNVLSSYARKHSMNVLMSNFSGQSWGQDSGGKSAFWNNKGELIAGLNDSCSGLLIIEKKEAYWFGYSIIKDQF